MVVGDVHVRTTIASAVMPANMAIASTPMMVRVAGGVAALRRLEVRHAVADRLDAGQRRAARTRTRAAPAAPAASPARCWPAVRCRYGATRPRGASPASDPDEPDRDHDSTTATKPYVGTANAVPDSLTPRRFITREQRDQPETIATACGAERRERRDDVVHAGGHRHRDRQHVVDQQRAGRDQRGVRGRGSPG